MIAIDLTATTVLLPYSHSFKRAWGLPCPHTVRELLRARASLEAEDLDVHWRCDRETHPELHWTNVAQPPQRVRRRARAERGDRREPSSFERVDRDLYQGLQKGRGMFFLYPHRRQLEEP